MLWQICGRKMRVWKYFELCGISRDSNTTKMTNDLSYKMQITCMSTVQHTIGCDYFLKWWLKILDNIRNKSNHERLISCPKLKLYTYLHIPLLSLSRQFVKIMLFLWLTIYYIAAKLAKYAKKCMHNRDMAHILLQAYVTLYYSAYL